MMKKKPVVINRGVPVAEYSMPQFVQADLDPLWLRVLSHRHTRELNGMRQPVLWSAKPQALFESFLPDAVQRLVGAEEQPAVADGGAAVEIGVVPFQFVQSKLLKLLAGG